MSQANDTERESRKWGFDKTLNIPTMLMIAGMTASAVMFVAKGWADQDRRIDAIERQTQSISQDVTRLDARQGTQGTQADAQISKLRDEFRGDLRDINGKLDALLLGRASNRPETKHWTRP